MNEITLFSPLDMHLHLREGDMLSLVAPYSAKGFVGGVVMPNLSSPITKAYDAAKYAIEIKNLVPQFTPIPTIYLTGNLNRDEIENCMQNEIKIIKLYPRGSTTNSSDGIDDIFDKNTLEVFKILEDKNLILSIHCETGGTSLDREFEFHKVLEQICKKFPKLMVILEHISDSRSIKLLKDIPNLYATMTLHHMKYSLDDLIGGKLNPHFFCKPVLKSPKNRDELLEFALSGNEKLSFGSDSAPHTIEAKLAGAAGIFSAPNLLESLVEIFDLNGALDKLQNFISDNAFKNYGLKNIKKDIACKLIKKECQIPQTIEAKGLKVVPLNANQKVGWSLL